MTNKWRQRKYILAKISELRDKNKQDFISGMGRNSLVIYELRSPTKQFKRIRAKTNGPIHTYEFPHTWEISN